MNKGLNSFPNACRKQRRIQTCHQGVPRPSLFCGGEEKQEAIDPQPILSRSGFRFDIVEQTNLRCGDEKSTGMAHTG